MNDKLLLLHGDIIGRKEGRLMLDISIVLTVSSALTFSSLSLSLSLKVLGAVFQDFLCRKEDFLRALRGFLRELVRRCEGFPFSVFARSLMQQRSEPEFTSLDQSHKVWTHSDISYTRVIIISSSILISPFFTFCTSMYLLPLSLSLPLLSASPLFFSFSLPLYCSSPSPLYTH